MVTYSSHHQIFLTASFYRAIFYDKKMGEEIDGALLGEAYNGYVFKITGGQDLQGFAMIQGVF